MAERRPTITLDKNGAFVRIWAPAASTLSFAPEGIGEEVALEPTENGYFEGRVENVRPGYRYRLRLDDDLIPDPFSRFQPEGVHGPSEIIDGDSYEWHEPHWKGISREDLVFYELHVGTFSQEGTFDGVRERLPYLRDLGITAVELMPVADFPGRWNWGYDPGALFAPSHNYGTPDELRALVDEAHRLGIAVFLDVVYNHLGPDGAYLSALGPLFTDRHETPWGQAVNLDDEHSAGVRRILIENACYWLREFHFDGLRLDATDALIDESIPHFLTELTETVDALDGPHRILVAEDHRNLNMLVQSREAGGHGLDAVWIDDFHHLMRNMLAGDDEGYFANFEGATAEDIAQTLRQGWFYTGQVAPSTGKPRGARPSDVKPVNCVYCIQNHDQVGNRPLGRRLSEDISPAAYRAASALLLFVPHLPLLFQGQEWAASTPFQFFTDHKKELGRKVTRGRKNEFEDFSKFEGEVPDPQLGSTYTRSILQWDERSREPHSRTLNLYRRLLALRRGLEGDFSATAVGRSGLVLRRSRHHLLVALEGGAALRLPENADVILHTEETIFAENGAPPLFRGAEVHFPTPGAAILRSPATGD